MSGKIKIGILLDSERIQAWQAEAIRFLVQTGIAEIPLIVVNKSPKPSGDPSPFLYRVYRKIDRIIFKGNRDAFESVELSSVLKFPFYRLDVKPIQKKYRDVFPSESIQEIQAYDLDVLIRFGFRILSGDILQVAKHGVWSYHHGDPTVYRGGPPAFWEVMNGWSVTGAVLLRLTEQLDQGQVLYQTFTQTTPLSVQRNANKLFWSSSFFLSRVVKQVHLLGWENWEKELGSEASTDQVPLLKPPGNWKMLGMILALSQRNGRRKIREFRKKPHWSIALFKGKLEGPQVLIQPEALDVWEHPDSDKYYWADPFPVFFEGKEYVLVEEYDKKNQQGQVVCLESKEGTIEIHAVVKEAWHLSYPFVWQEGEEVYLIPESAEAGKLFLYRASDFPSQWERLGILLDDEAYDPTLIKLDGLYWLFVNQKAHPECSPFDELFLYFSEDLKHTTWQAHPQNPIVSDVRTSRPAGNLFFQNGKLYRPAQDSGLHYGHRVHIQEVESLSRQEYREKTIQTLESSPGFVSGIHTFNQGKNGVWIDTFRRK